MKQAAPAMNKIAEQAEKAAQYAALQRNLQRGQAAGKIMIEPKTWVANSGRHVLKIPPPPIRFGVLRGIRQASQEVHA